MIGPLSFFRKPFHAFVVASRQESVDIPILSMVYSLQIYGRAPRARGDGAMIPFNVPPSVGKELEYIAQAIANQKISGDGAYTKKCHAYLEETTKTKKALLTTSCTHALELAALLCDIKEGDEVIMPSYTFVSTANAFALRGAKIVFVDIRTDTMNIDENLIEAAVTPKTKAIVPVHYAGVSCEMDKIMRIAREHRLFVVEDAAQGMQATYRGRHLGALGDFGCYSFHETKNISCGEGGALLINREEFIERAEIIREKGTDRGKFFRGQVDKYTWVDIGSSYLMSEINAAYLYAQFEAVSAIQSDRMRSHQLYKTLLRPLVDEGTVETQQIPAGCRHNAHMFYIKCKDMGERTRLIAHLKENGILAIFHYIPLHTAPKGLVSGAFSGGDRYTTAESERLLRLPLYYGLKEPDVSHIVHTINRFYEG